MVIKLTLPYLRAYFLLSSHVKYNLCIVKFKHFSLTLFIDAQIDKFLCLKVTFLYLFVGNLSFC